MPANTVHEAARRLLNKSKVDLENKTICEKTRNERNTLHQLFVLVEMITQSSSGCRLMVTSFLITFLFL